MSGFNSKSRTPRTALLLSGVSLVALVAFASLPAQSQQPPQTAKEKEEEAKRKAKGEQKGQPPAGQPRPQQQPPPPPRQEQRRPEPPRPAQPAPPPQPPRAAPPPPPQPPRAAPPPPPPPRAAPPPPPQPPKAQTPPPPQVQPKVINPTPPPAQPPSPPAGRRQEQPSPPPSGALQRPNGPVPPAAGNAPPRPPTPPPTATPATPAPTLPSTAPAQAKPDVPPSGPGAGQRPNGPRSGQPPGAPGTNAPGTPPPAATTAPQVPPPAVAPPATPGAAPQPPANNPSRQGFRPLGTPAPTGTVVAPLPGPARLDQVKAARTERTDQSGRRIIQEPGNRTLIRQNNTVIIHRNETQNIQNFYPGARSIRRPGGITETFYVRPDGVRIITEVDGAGRIVRRYGRPPRGPEIVFVDNRRFYRNLAIGVGLGAVGVGLALALAPPAHALPRERYIVDYTRASDEDIYETLSAPPVARLERAYSLDEVRYSHPLREHMRRIDLDTLTFDTGSFEIGEDQYRKLERIARSMARAIEKNPAEMFLIEGHTDKVGSAEDNLSLSDRRAEAVGRVLTEYFSIPMENIITQGYGEQHPKVDTDGEERANRRVAIRRIGPLLGQNQQQ